ncbi:MAG: porin [Mesorhizobium sp. 61-13]|nr:porin [Mesorhizobium sp.]OJU48588.1 MAG: porin [Mesorhizobium sp. 61-13]
MNIKSLLLGSAAALFAVSGARAADAVVVAEPEPAEYVKICDVYGTGYFYIPGTETCLRIGGYVRYDIGVGDREGHQDVTDLRDGSLNDTYHKQARLSLRTWTGSETELGTLKTYTETRFNFRDGHDTNQSTWSLNFAWIQLGGLRVGKDESVFTTFTGYAGNVIDDTIVGYGPFDTNLISYYFDAGNGFSAVVSLEEGAGVDSIDSYVPHVVVGAKYTQGWGGISAVGAYDSNWEEFTGKVRLDVNASEQLSLFVMGGWGTSDDVTDLLNGGQNFYKNWGGDWAIWGGASYQVNEKTALNLQASYDDAETLGVVANVAYTVVPGFTVTAEVDYYDTPVDDGIGGILRFQRSF